MRRFFQILFAYYLASLAATNTGIILGYFRNISNGSLGNHTHELHVAVSLSFLFAIVFAFATVIQSGILIVLGEAMELRRPYYFCFGGALSALILYLFLKNGQPPLPPPNPGILDNRGLVFLLSGFVGGIAYWATATFPHRKTEAT